MKTNWTYDPIGLFAAAAQSTAGGVLLSAAAWICGTWIYMCRPAEWFERGFSADCDLQVVFVFAIFAPLLIFAANVLFLIGIPFVITQWICAYQIILGDEPRLHRCFVLAYCQVLLMHLAESVWTKSGFFDDHALNGLLSLLILFFAHLICVSVLYFHYRLSQRQ